jgi:hypothetical protein
MKECKRNMYSSHKEQARPPLLGLRRVHECYKRSLVDVIRMIEGSSHSMIDDQQKVDPHPGTMAFYLHLDLHLRHHY